MQRPEVSVVIPTRNRPELVVRAVRSALAQTVREIEVVVIIDGPDQATVAALKAIGDERIRPIELPASGGAPAARNHGVDAANADWVAFLDDDDEWLPEKLATQLARARAADVPLPIVGSRLYMRTPRAELIMPRRVPAPGEPISEYLAVRHGFFHGDGFIQTSTIMAPTALLRKVPFAVGLRRLQELDWTLRSLQEEGVDLIYAEEPLVVWYADENRPRISFDAPWKQSLEWLQQTRPRVTPRAYAALAMSVVGSMAAASRSPRVFFDLLREARRHGKPSFHDYVTFLQVWLVPAGPRRIVRDFFLSRQRDKGATAQ
ncbi:glycosyltransferase family 2 protein [Dactylosporangium sucinum]|uniref:glycosyltransferase family 2 protein n=1 Tax=Dactylosporangium sucinum TaxID=1424081 RepID=UPI001E2B18AA|nr:glycosyltransferase family 2 protein [Dactylosporangium sucinum]